MRRTALSVIVIAGLLVTPDARGQALEVESAHRLHADPHPFPVVESYLAVNPANPDNLIASAMSTSANQAVVYVSADGGATWTTGTHENGTVFPGGDPMTVFDGQGRAYLTTIDPGIRVWHSDDGGRTWTGPAWTGDAGRYDDRQWVAASPVLAHRDTVVVAAAKTWMEVGGREQDVIVTTYSSDRGESFSEPLFTPIGSGFLHVVSNLVVSASGTVLMPYVVNYGRTGDGLIRGTVWMRRSTDGGRSWSEPFEVAERLSYGNDAGNVVWMSLGVTSLAEDTSGGRHDGRLYMTWPAVMDGVLQIVLVRSDDGGRTWSTPMRVNRGGLSAHLGTPMVAVNRDGLVAVSWNDRRNYPDVRCYQHRVAISGDGGQSFTPGQIVSDQPTCPRIGSRWMNGGETQGLVALPDGRFRVLWSVGGSSDFTLWTALIRVERATD